MKSLPLGLENELFRFARVDLIKVLRRDFSKFCFLRKSNLKVLKFYFDKYCYCRFKARFLKTNYFRLLEKIS